MKRIGIILLVIILLQACEKVPEVSFHIIPAGFFLDNSSQPQDFSGPPFIHRISGGVVTFIDDRGSFQFDLRNVNLEDFLFTLPAGDYQLEFNITPASLYGQELASFTTEPVIISLDEKTDTVFLEVEANCSLFLVDDRLQQLDQGAYMIKRHSFSTEGYYLSFPLLKDAMSGLYYTYFRPDPHVSDPSAFLWFYEGRPGNAGSTEGGLSTCGFEVGQEYYIRILE